jgi:hypothetical protein
VDGEVYEVNEEEESEDRSQKPEGAKPSSGAGSSSSKSKSLPVNSERKLGTARGVIEFRPGWDDPITEEELWELLGE